MNLAPSHLPHLLELDDLGPDGLNAVLELAEQAQAPPVLAGRGVALLFEKPSLRTRASMEMAAVQLGAHPVAFRGDEVGIDTRETAEDLARVLSGYFVMIGARVHRHRTLERLAAASSVPVVNLLSDAAHPCQVLADLLTLRRRFGRLDGRTLAYVGDGNIVCHSLLVGAAMAGMRLRVASPRGYEPGADALERARRQGGEVEVTGRADEAVAGADAVYTDVWASMGQEEEAAARRQAFAGFTVDERLMARAEPGAVFLHCLPAHRGEEVAGEVVDGPRSLVWEQAANRLPAQRGLLLWLSGALGSGGMGE